MDWENAGLKVWSGQFIKLKYMVRLDAGTKSCEMLSPGKLKLIVTD